MMNSRLLLLVTACFLSACSQSVETRVSSAGVGAIEASSFQVAIPDKAASAELLTAYRLVADHLTANGIRSSDSGVLFLEVGVSARPAHIGLTKPGKMIAIADGKNPSKHCPKQEYRLSAVLTRIADGAEQYRGAAGEYHCKYSLQQMLPLLAEKAMADLKNPRGDYVLKRPLKQP